MVTRTDWQKWRFEGGDRWSEWMPFLPQTVDHMLAKPGAYVLGLPTSRTHAAPLGRLLGPDVHGILDVGEAANLRERIACLQRCASTKGERGHMAGWRLGTMGLLSMLDLTSDDLQLSVCYADSKEEAYRIEGTILRIYYRLFGELPPLNYKFNWSAWEEA